MPETNNRTITSVLRAALKLQSDNKGYLDPEDCVMLALGHDEREVVRTKKSARKQDSRNYYNLYAAGVYEELAMLDPDSGVAQTLMGVVEKVREVPSRNLGNRLAGALNMRESYMKSKVALGTKVGWRTMMESLVDRYAREKEKGTSSLSGRAPIAHESNRGSLVEDYTLEIDEVQGEDAGVERSLKEVLAELNDGTAEVGRESIFLCDTPSGFVMLGLEQLPIYMTRTHAVDIMHPIGQNPHWHGLGVDLLSVVPEMLASPAVVMDSTNRSSRSDAIVVLLARTDEQGLPLLAAIKPCGTASYECSMIESNQLLSVYGKERAAEYVAAAVAQKKVLFVDSKQLSELEKASGVDFRESLGETPRDKLLHQSKAAKKAKRAKERTVPAVPERKHHVKRPEDDERRARERDSGTRKARPSGRARK